MLPWWSRFKRNVHGSALIPVHFRITHLLVTTHFTPLIADCPTCREPEAELEGRDIHRHLDIVMNFGVDGNASAVARVEIAN